MQRLFSAFPSRSAGVALVLLRFCLAASLLCAAFLRPSATVSPVLLVAASVVALAAVAGAMLPFTCVAAVALHLILARLTDGISPISVVIDAVHGVALALLGAGAYSVDAMLYGRRIVVLPKNR